MLEANPVPISAAQAEADLALLVTAAREAGEIALRHWRRDPAVWDKGGGAGPVTEADLAVNAHLHARLTAARPDYGWLSEESEADPARLDAAHCFVIDPIDGTRAFIDGQDGFSHALAVVRGDRVIAGVVYLPARDRLYTAAAGGGAWCNGARIAPRPGADVDGASVLTYRGALDAAGWRGGAVPPLRRQFRPSLAWRLCLIAEGAFDVALSLRAAWEWDIAAGALIAEAAGCAVTDRRGRPMRFNSASGAVDGLLIAAPGRHAAVLAALA